MSIPLPFLTAIVALAFAARIATLRSTPLLSRMSLCLLFVVFTAESLLAGVRFGYGYEGLIALQRLLPFFVGPLAWLGFVGQTRPIPPSTVALHIGGGVLLCAIALWVNSTGRFDLIEVLITASYLVYISLLVRLWRQGPDALALLPLGQSTRQHYWLGGLTGLLIFILFLDGAIAIAFYLGRGDLAGAIIFVASAPLLAGALIFAVIKLTAAEARHKPKASADLMDQIDTLMAETQIYCEPDLSLARLAARLGAPVKQISRTINASTGANVSQYINKWRVEHAADLLINTDLKVIAVSQDAGFLTRSNFYREFKQHYGQSPASYRREVRTP